MYNTTCDQTKTSKMNVPREKAHINKKSKSKRKNTMRKEGIRKKSLSMHLRLTHDASHPDESTRKKTPDEGVSSIITDTVTEGEKIKIHKLKPKPRMLSHLFFFFQKKKYFEDFR